MTQLLVSVRNAPEALDALAGGADLIDIKEPLAGSLGAASPAAIGQVIAAVDGRAPVSVALGELVDIPGKDLSFCTGATYAKVGLAGALGDPNWPQRWKNLIQCFPDGVRPVAVIYADYAHSGAPNPSEVLTHAAQFGCVAVLIDTFNKTQGRLTEQWTIDELQQLAHRVRQAGMLFVVAGSLAATDLPAIAPLAADYIAVRSAVCESQRTGRLAQHLVQQLADEIKRQSAAMDSAKKLPHNLLDISDQ